MIDAQQHIQEVANKLKHLRKQKSKSQTQIAKKIEIPKPRYASYEEGRAVVPFMVIVKLCAAYEMTLDQFQNLKITTNHVSRI